MTPAMTKRRPTGDTIGQHWQTLEDDEARREYLLKIGMKVKITPGQPPLFEVFAGARDPGGVPPRASGHIA